MNKILETVNYFVWGIPALILILGVGLFLSIGTGFVQLRFFPKALKAFAHKFRGGKKEQSGTSQWQALCTALSATIGTGNIAGVAGAIAIGGPGAVFWMWICAILGMVTKYAEATLAVRYRRRSEKGGWIGGPMYMIQCGMGRRYIWLAGVYCFFGVVAALGVGNATQVNAVISGVSSALEAVGLGCPREVGWLTGLCLAVLVALMLSGGARRIGNVAEKLVPFAAGGYLILAAGLLLLRLNAIPAAIGAILQGAFSPQAVTGGVIGSVFQALRVGASRGVFTNEAGMGTASIAHASAEVQHPAEQGLMGIMEVFLDTIVICTMTALVILCSDAEITYGSDMGASLTSEAFSTVYGAWVCVPIAGALCCFAVATILGWGLYGARCAQFLFGEKAWRPFVVLQTVTVLVSALLRTDTVWLISETLNGLMAIPNLIALAWLSPELFRLTKDYKSLLAGVSANGGTYANFNQRKPLRALSYAEISSAGSGSKKERKDHLPSEYRSAGSGNTPGLL